MFYALRGDGGRTTAFTDNSDETVPGFIELHSVLTILKEDSYNPYRTDLFDQLYRKGLPWAQRDRSQTVVDGIRAHSNAFLCCNEEYNPDGALEAQQSIMKRAESLFSPRLVHDSDPSEIIFYTELAAFPIYYLSELSDMQRHYQALVHDSKAMVPLHIDQDYPQFQSLIPLNSAQLASSMFAWRIFVEAQMLGLIRSQRQQADNDLRIVFWLRRRAGAFDVQWVNLGTEGRAIEKIALTPDLRSHLHDDIEAERERFLAMPAGKLYHLIALADYYAYCIFPVRSSEYGQGVTIPLSSMQSQVCRDLRYDWRTQQSRNEPDIYQLEQRVKRVLHELANWSTPIFRTPQQPVPCTPEVPEQERLEEWGLADIAFEAVCSFVARKIMPKILDQLGSPRRRFPRLAIDWEYFGMDQAGLHPKS
jgi:hypothetical protein